MDTIKSIISVCSDIMVALSNVRDEIKSYDKELIYPDEDIADGLRIEYTRVSEPFVAEALETTTSYGSGTNISYYADEIHWDNGDIEKEGWVLEQKSINEKTFFKEENKIDLAEISLDRKKIREQEGYVK